MPSAGKSLKRGVRFIPKVVRSENELYDSRACRLTPHVIFIDSAATAYAAEKERHFPFSMHAATEFSSFSLMARRRASAAMAASSAVAAGSQRSHSSRRTISSVSCSAAHMR